MSNILDGARELNEKHHASKPNPTVEDVLKLIKQHTFGCVVAGGYCRDTFFGVTPKDIDICVYDFYPDDYAEGVLLQSLQHELDKLGVGFTNISSQFDEGCADEEYIVNDARVYEVWKLAELNVDIILYNGCNNFMDVVSKFDFNLNQFYLPSTVPNFFSDYTEFEYNPSLEEAPVYVGVGELSELIQIKDELTPERVVKMKTKHRAFFPHLYNVDPLLDIPW